MKKLLFQTLFTFSVGMFIWSSCTFDTTPRALDCDNLSDISFSEDVMPIIQTNCAISGCHNSTTSAGGYTLTGYNGVKQVVDNSRLKGVINHESGFSNMPPSSQLVACDIEIIETWIDEGANDN